LNLLKLIATRLADKFINRHSNSLLHSSTQQLILNLPVLLPVLLPMLSTHGATWHHSFYSDMCLFYQLSPVLQMNLFLSRLRKPPLAPGFVGGYTVTTLDKTDRAQRWLRSISILLSTMLVESYEI
jgi:hypothetical protein